MTPIQENLFRLHNHLFTGKLTLTKDQVNKTIYFKKGNPIYVDSNLRSETLGQMLLDQGRVTGEQYGKILEAMQATQKRQGEIIVELGFMSAFEVYEALRAQAERKFQNCFLLEGAEIHMDQGESFLAGIPEFAIDFFRCFVELYLMATVPHDAFPPEKAIQLTSAGKKYLDQRSLMINETKLIRQLDGTKNYDEIVAASQGDPDDDALLLYVLMDVGFISLSDLPSREFIRSASRVKASRYRGRVEETSPRSSSSPIYKWTLRLDRPYAELLGVSPSAPKTEIQEKYESLVKELHLDAIAAHYDEKDRAVAENVFHRLTLAATVLSDETARKQHLRDLAQKNPPKDLTPALSAEICLQKARLLMQKKNYAQAEQEILKAVEHRPEESAYRVALAELHMQQAIAEKKPFPPDVERSLQKAVDLNSTDYQALFQLGVYHKFRSDFAKAEGFFSKVLKLHPDHQEALSELHFISQFAGPKKGAV